MKAKNIKISFEIDGKEINVELESATVDFGNHLHKIGESRNFEEFKSGVKGIAFNKWVFDNKSNKPLKDQSYHQKRIADSLEKIAKAKDGDIVSVPEEMLGGKDFIAVEKQLTEEDVIRIVSARADFFKSTKQEIAQYIYKIDSEGGNGVNHAMSVFHITYQELKDKIG